MKSLVALLICSLPLASSAETAVRQLSVAVVQFESIDGDIAGNLKNAERWLDRAVAAGAQLIVFPEFMPTGVFLGRSYLGKRRTMTGPTVRWLIRQSEKHRA